MVLPLLLGDEDARAAGMVVNEIDSAKGGPKIRALVTSVWQLISADPTVKLILFSQFRRLTTLISRVFSSSKVQKASIAGGNVFRKCRAATLFCTNPNMKVFLSSDDCISGLHLVEASHVVIVHPHMSFAYEMQNTC
ncbi:hypothetical protein GGF31_008222 [Allomyces arbusculus]|nr:hypothetical protein GGF31_008222 [Allomyces arbusculus]